MVSEEILLEDLEDGVRLKNQWLIRTPSKSFFVAAPSSEEKQAWMGHIEDSRAGRLQVCSLRPNWQPRAFAVSLIPGRAAEKCMRCCRKKFTATKHRHHCRKCGFVVCSSCSEHRELLSNIHPRKQVRVCSACHAGGKDQEAARQGSEDDEPAPSSEEEGEGREDMQSRVRSSWLDFRMGTWGHMDGWV